MMYGGTKELIARLIAFGAVALLITGVGLVLTWGMLQALQWWMER